MSEYLHKLAVSVVAGRYDVLLHAPFYDLLHFIGFLFVIQAALWSILRSGSFL
jgi:hypothetical protein